MSDLSSFWNIDNVLADWAIGHGDLISGNDLQSAIIISLFTDRLARSDDDYEENRRGWWGDTPEYKMGSRLWLLRRQLLKPEVAQKADEYIKEALQWMIDDNVVSAIQTATQIVWPNRLNIVIRYQSPIGDSWKELKYFWVWES